MSPLISVIMAAYNAADYIEGSIQSVLDQTIKDLEVVVVDDCSKDNTTEIVERMAAADPRVRLIRFEKNAGPGAARHHAVKGATGAWISVIDSDDTMLPDRLEKMLAVAEDGQFDMVADNLNYVNVDTGERFGTAIPLDEPGTVWDITTEQFVLANLPGETGFKLGFLKPIVRHDFLQKHAINYQEPLRVAEDYEFVFAILLHGAKFGLMNDCYYDYLIRPDSVSHTYTDAQLIQIGELSREALGHSLVTGNKSVLAAVQKRQIYCDRNSAYIRVIGQAKKKNPVGLATAMVKDVAYLPYIFWRAFRVVTKGRVWGSKTASLGWRTSNTTGKANSAS